MKEWEKISDKGFVYGIHKEHLQFNNYNPVRKWAKDLNRHLAKITEQE